MFNSKFHQKVAGRIVAVSALALGLTFVGIAPAQAADVTVSPPSYTPGDCINPGTVDAPNTDDYTWTTSGGTGARTYTAVLVDPVNDSFIGQYIYGPYNLNITNYLDPACQPFFTVASAQCGHIEIAFHNQSRWNWNPDYHYDGDGVTPTDYGSGPTYTNVQVLAGVTSVIFDHTFPEGYNGGQVTVSYQSILGPESDVAVAAQSMDISTNCAVLADSGVSQEALAMTGGIGGAALLSGIILLAWRRRLV